MTTYCHEERIDMEKKDLFDDATIRRHIIRYQWAARTLKGRYGRVGHVLDFACGTGYGAPILLDAAHRVTGGDRSAEAVAIAKDRYMGGLADFFVSDAVDLENVVKTGVSRSPRRINAVVCIETIEHVQHDIGLLCQFGRILPVNGPILISTPLRAAGQTLSDKPANRFHVREYIADDLRDALKRSGFKDIVIDMTVLSGFICATARNI